jgi:hypothetical protein
MAFATLGMPTFSGKEDEDLFIFIDLYRGYLNAIGIDPADVAGNPTGASRAMGILRSCMKGQAADWFDRNITGKNWKLNNIMVILANGNTAALRALALNAVAANTFRPLSAAANFAGAAGNAALLVGNTVFPNRALVGVDEAWGRAGGQPTTDPPNYIGGAGPAIINAPGFGAGHPYVFPNINPGQALFFLRTQYPTILEEKRRLRFGTLSQDHGPIRDYYDKVKRSGELLNFGNEVITDQFFRGLSPDNIIEIERIGIDKPMGELVDILERVERRKAEMLLGLSKRNTQQEIQRRDILPIQMPPVTQQEPTIMKPVTEGFSQEQLEQLLKSQAENLTRSFQSQIDALQSNLSVPDQNVEAQSQSRPFVRKKIVLADRKRFGLSKPSEIAEKEMQRYELDTDLVDDDWLDNYKMRRQNAMIANKIDNMTRMLKNLNLRDPDDMDTSDLVRGKEIEFDDDEYTLQLVRKKK